MSIKKISKNTVYGKTAKGNMHVMQPLRPGEMVFDEMVFDEATKLDRMIGLLVDLREGNVYPKNKQAIFKPKCMTVAVARAWGYVPAPRLMVRTDRYCRPTTFVLAGAQ